MAFEPAKLLRSRLFSSGDPYPLFRAARSMAPVYKVADDKVCALFRHADCVAALRDPHLGRPEEGDTVPLLDSTTAPLEDGSERSLLFLNPPDHTRLRSLVSRAFTPLRVRGLRPPITDMTAEYIDDLAATGGGDLLPRLAYALPVNVISDLVGVPRSDSSWLRPIMVDVVARIGPVDADVVERGLAARDTAGEYFSDLIAQRRAAPADDLLSGLIEAADGEDRLTHDEIVQMVLLLYAAGFETTASLLGSMTYTLLRHPDQLNRLRADRSLVPTAVEESLRFEPPVWTVVRYARADTEIAGEEVPRGWLVLILLGSANRDPALVDDPESFDVGRREVPHLSFAAGIHYCLGAALTRLEGEVVLSALLDRFETWELLEEQLPWRQSVVIRALERLPVALS